MRVQFVTNKEVLINSLSTKTYPKGWAGEIADEIAVACILDESAVDPTGELTRDVLVAEIERRQAIIDAGGDPDATEAEDVPAPVDLSALKVGELREIAAANGIENAATMKKAELIEALTALAAPADDQQQA
jgi:hypothetical protein